MGVRFARTHSQPGSAAIRACAMDFAGVDMAAAGCLVDELAAVGADGNGDATGLAYGVGDYWRCFGAINHPGQSRSSCNRFGLVRGHYGSQLSKMEKRAQLTLGPPPVKTFSMM